MERCHLQHCPGASGGGKIDDLVVANFTMLSLSPTFQAARELYKADRAIFRRSRLAALHVRWSRVLCRCLR